MLIRREIDQFLFHPSICNINGVMGTSHKNSFPLTSFYGTKDNFSLWCQDCRAHTPEHFGFLFESLRAILRKLWRFFRNHWKKSNLTLVTLTFDLETPKTIGLCVGIGCIYWPSLVMIGRLFFELSQWPQTHKHTNTQTYRPTYLAKSLIFAK